MTSQTLADTPLLGLEVGRCCMRAKSSRHTHESTARSRDLRVARTCRSEVVAAITVIKTAATKLEVATERTTRIESETEVGGQVVQEAKTRERLVTSRWKSWSIVDSRIVESPWQPDLNESPSKSALEVLKRTLRNPYTFQCVTQCVQTLV